MLQLGKDRLVGTVQHGGSFGGGGQMASSAGGAAKVAGCMGNATGTLKPKAWSVITYNAGLHDCDASEFVNAMAYEANIRAVLEMLKPAAHAVVFVKTTPYDVSAAIPDGKDAGIHMPCVLHYNEIAKRVATEVGAILVDDLYGYAEAFCDVPGNTFSKVEPGNYSKCAVQTTGLHFFTGHPAPSGQQYTGFSVANAVARALPVGALAPPAAGDDRGHRLSAAATASPCGAPPQPLNATLPNVHDDLEP